MIKTDELKISNTDEAEAKALKVVDEFLDKLDKPKDKKLHYRLLAEETVGMVKAMAKEFNALFWVEEENGQFRVRLTVETDMDLDKKSELLSVSTSGVNASAKGLMGKIREIIENGLLNFDAVMKLEQQYSGGYVEYAFLGRCDGEVPLAYPIEGESMVWSLQNYKDALSEASETKAPEKEAWDELEKSIVGNIAKDVIVGVRKNHVEMTIIAE